MYVALCESEGRLVFSSYRLDSPPSLETMQGVVGGLIETMFTIPSPYRENVEITGYVNEEGLLIGLPICGVVLDEYGYRPFAGNMVMTGLKDGDTVSLTEGEVGYLRSSWSGMKLTLLPTAILRAALNADRN